MSAPPLGRPVSEEQRMAFVQKAERMAAASPTVVEHFGLELTIGLYYTGLLDKARCGHLPCGEFIRCIFEEEEGEAA